MPGKGSSLFDYDATGAPPERLTFLPDRDQQDWDVLLGHTELRRFAAGDVVVRRDERERALYLLSAGTLSVHADNRSRAFKTIVAPSVVGEIGFLDGGPRAADLVAVTPVEMRRLGYDAFESLSARHPELARAILFDLGRIVAARLRSLTHAVAEPP